MNTNKLRPLEFMLTFNKFTAFQKLGRTMIDSPGMADKPTFDAVRAYTKISNREHIKGRSRIEKKGSRTLQ